MPPPNLTWRHDTLCRPHYPGWRPHTMQSPPGLDILCRFCCPGKSAADMQCQPDCTSPDILCRNLMVGDMLRRQPPRTKMAVRLTLHSAQPRHPSWHLPADRDQRARASSGCKGAQPACPPVHKTVSLGRLCTKLSGKLHAVAVLNRFEFKLLPLILPLMRSEE